MVQGDFPRIVIAGLSGDSGKTVVTCGIISYLIDAGLNVSAFKKGPDYIDAAWLSLASVKPARNLDTYLMGFAAAKKSFLKNANNDGINVIEGNRGLLDGVDTVGTHSTAELAKLLEAPIVLVQDVSRVTRTAAASILGCIKLDSAMKLAGVILNRVANDRHARVVAEAIQDTTGVSVLGSIPRLPARSILPSRHLGLITPGEFERRLLFLREVKSVVEQHLDMAAIIEAARRAHPLEYVSTREQQTSRPLEGEDGRVRIAYFRDESFSFYYPENLELLEAAGAELIPVSPARGRLASDPDALYIGGGFPEMNLEELALNKEMITAVKQAAEAGMPVYAECGGLIYLAKTIEWDGKEFPLSGILPIKVRMQEKPQGHGYCEAVVNGENPFFLRGTVIKGHEFHYSSIVEHDPQVETSFVMLRGSGSFGGRDGLTYKNVLASYIHVHATASPEWVSGMIDSARKYRDLKKNADNRGKENSCKHHKGDYVLDTSTL